MRRFVFSLIITASWTVASGNAQELSKSEESHAKRLYNLKCSKCHEFYEPSGYSENDWQQWMIKMKKKSHLSQSDYELLLRYTGELRKQHSSRP
jgi:nitrate/TMAO reductase-like tetraheme cytochrome c subunit